jgi:nitrogen-specific signal transduction histidine kinase
LTPDVRAVIEVLAGQIAIAIDDWRLVEENVRLERKLAEGERLAALGQMAATVAHEVKNPLSAIKSIAQVMSEDEALSVQHARDLSLIVGETDRLNKSVTQLLSFAGKRPAAATPSSAAEIIQSVVGLFRVDAEERNITLRFASGAEVRLNGISTGAVRDALSNLILNALQATPSGGEVKLESIAGGDEVVFVVSDDGPGIPEQSREKIWEPFFTTRQRGTGLGLAIVRKRMQDAGGSARLVPSLNGKGARFEIRVPYRSIRSSEYDKLPACRSGVAACSTDSGTCVRTEAFAVASTTSCQLVEAGWQPALKTLARDAQGKFPENLWSAGVRVRVVLNWLRGTGEIRLRLLIVDDEEAARYGMRRRWKLSLRNCRGGKRRGCACLDAQFNVRSIVTGCESSGNHRSGFPRSNPIRKTKRQKLKRRT